MTLPTEYQRFIHLSRYARWKELLGRREKWNETVIRYLDYWHLKDYLDSGTYEELYDSIRNLEVMPSMRALMTAGPALERDHVAGYNCSYVAMEDYISFDEVMYILMCGTGVGFSVERQYIAKLPVVGEGLKRTLPKDYYLAFPGVDQTELSIVDRGTNTIIVLDSKYGWASAFRLLIEELYNGNFDIKWDTSLVRPAGARLNTFGGRASGPAPLEDLFRFSVKIFKTAQGRKLTSIEVHDLVCKIADIVVVGGVRRSALISLSNLSDDRMRNAKSGQWWENNGQRALANISTAYTEKPEIGSFIREWINLYESKSGERGVFSRTASQMTASRSGRRDPNFDFGTNPCSEIILRSKQFCNLSEVVIRADDSLETLKRKVRIATILGTLQATQTNFKYLSEGWRKNTEEEALLGVSLTGIMDHPTLSGQEGLGDLGQLKRWLEELKSVAIETNQEWAARLGISPSAAITCVKPSGTVSQLVDSASGIHPRYSEFYIRTVRADKKDPLAQFMVDVGFPVEDDVTKPDHNWVFSFPMKSPKESIMRDDMTALDQLELWKVYQEHWCEHKPSITVYVREHEWLDVGAWVYKHFDSISGVSFLPHTEHVYQQAPYQEIKKEEYLELVSKMPKEVDWGKLSEFESDDFTVASQELACVAGVCEI